MKRIPAFTITDLIVTMIISMLVVGIAFTIFRFTYNQLYRYSEMNDEYKELYQFYAVMQEDFQRASEISYSPGELQMLMLAGKEYRYILSDDYIIRETNIKADTFHINTQQIIAKFDGEEQFAGLADEISITIVKGDVTFPFTFIKEYSAEMLMGLEEEK